MLTEENLNRYLDLFAGSSNLRPATMGMLDRVGQPWFFEFPYYELQQSLINPLASE